MKILKQYLKTVVSSIKYCASFLVTFFILSPVAASLFRLLKIPVPSSTVILICPCIAVFALSIIARSKDTETAREYRQSAVSSRLDIIKDILSIVSSRQFICDIFGCITYVLLLCIIAWRIIFHSNAVISILVLLLLVVIFALMNTASYLLVHKMYLSKKAD